MWTIRRTLIMLLFLIVFCAGVLLVTRQYHLRDGLQKLGFRECEGMICFGNAIMGMRWAEAQALPNVLAQPDGELDVTDGSLGPIRIEFWPSHNANPVLDAMRLNTSTNALPITLGDIIQYWGVPCQVLFFENLPAQVIIMIRYDGGEAYIPVTGANISARPVFRLKSDSPISEFWLYASPNPRRCSCVVHEERGVEYCGKWEGFTNTEVYLARKAHEASVAP